MFEFVVLCGDLAHREVLNAASTVAVRSKFLVRNVCRNSGGLETAPPVFVPGVTDMTCLGADRAKWRTGWDEREPLLAGQGTGGLAAEALGEVVDKVRDVPEAGRTVGGGRQDTRVG